MTIKKAESIDSAFFMLNSIVLKIVPIAANINNDGSDIPLGLKEIEGQNFKFWES